MNTGFQLDLGKSPVKVSSRDTLLWLMRGIVADSVGNGTVTRQDAVARWRERVAEHPDHDLLLEQMEEHYGLLLFQRCTVPAENRDPDKSQEMRRRVRETIASQIMLSTWVVPGIGKSLPDCTFAEIAEAAPVAGRFLAKLSAEGAPGTLVREVFPDEDALQAFWAQAQNKP
jgi:hypothetical protein